MAREFFANSESRSLKDWAYDSLEEYIEPFRSNLHKLLVNLYVFERDVRHPMLTARSLLQYTLIKGPTFAKELDKIRAATLGKLGKLNYFDDEIVSTLKTYGINNDITPENFQLDCMYRPNMLFNWDAPELDLKDVCYIPVNITTEVDLEFRKSIREVLTNPKLCLFQETPWKDIENDNSKKCVEGVIYEQPRCPPATKRGVSLLRHIPRELKEKRLACIEEYASVLKTRWIETNVTKVLTAFPQSAMKLKPRTIKFQLTKAITPKKTKYWSESIGRSVFKDNEAPYSYCRDFKKEGLTKPRRLLRIMLEELKARLPFTTVFNDVGYFDNWEPEDLDGVIYHLY